MQLISTFSILEISTFFSVIEIYITMSEISYFLLSVLISQVAPYLMFILVSKSTHPVILVFSSQNAQCFYISAPLCIRIWKQDSFVLISIGFGSYHDWVPSSRHLTFIPVLQDVSKKVYSWKIFQIFWNFDSLYNILYILTQLIQISCLMIHFCAQAGLKCLSITHFPVKKATEF